MGFRGSSRRLREQPSSSAPDSSLRDSTGAPLAAQFTPSASDWSSAQRRGRPARDEIAPAPAPSPIPSEEELTEVVSGTGGPFLNRSIGIWESSPLCEIVRPSKEMGPFPLRLGVQNYTAEQIWKGHKEKVPMRAMIWAARMGLGNSLQGFVCALVVSVLSGRQLIVSPGGQFGSLVETLPLGFEFNVDIMGKAVPRVPGINKGQTELTDPRPVLQTQPIRFCDDVWHEPERHHCVYQAFNCQDEWCVHSRSIAFLLGRPRVALGRAVLRTIEFAPPRPGVPAGSHGLLDLGNGLSPSQTGKRASADRETKQYQAQAPEGVSTGTEHDTGAAGRDVNSSVDLTAGRGDEKYGGSLDFVPSTAEEALEIEFDIAVHIRTVHKCTETWAKDVPGCHENGLPGALEAADQVEVLRRALSLKNWGCLSHLLAFLFKLKAKRQQEQGVAYRGLFRTMEDEEELKEFVHEKHKRQAKRPKEYLNASSDPLEKHGLWRIDDANAVGEVARQEAAANLTAGEALGPKGQLNMFVATDSAVLRPLLIRYLKPFGSVAYSKAKPVHLSYYRFDQSSRLGNLGEFYLMGRAAVVFSFQVFWLGKSTFARVAALYGNSTLIFGSNAGKCTFGLEHVARSKDKWHL